MPSRRSAVAPAIERMLKAIEDVGLSQSRREDLAVAVSEALSNAAVHGNHLQRGSRVRITVETNPDHEVAVEIEDSGSGFDRSILADPTDPVRILETGGRGVFLMHRLADRVEYNDTGNRVRLTMSKRRRRRRDAD